MVPDATLDGIVGVVELLLATQYAAPSAMFVHPELISGFMAINWVSVIPNCVSIAVQVSPLTTVWYCVQPAVIVPSATFGGIPPEGGVEVVLLLATQYADPNAIFVHCAFTSGFMLIN